MIYIDKLHRVATYGTMNQNSFILMQMGNG